MGELWRLGRVVKAVDSKSTGLRPHRFESGRRRPRVFCTCVFGSSWSVVIFVLARLYVKAAPGAGRKLVASIAQLAEHLPRKQKVSSSILDGGCLRNRAVGLEV